tara:strand:- start:3702 stop:3965 length:264 start_codon:yes stop_codon:yes gene_type:complete
MKVSTAHGDFTVNAISFKDRRKLHRLEVGAMNSDESVSQSGFMDMMDWIMEYAFKDPEKSLSKLTDGEVDEVLIAVYNAYKDPNKKK